MLKATLEALKRQTQLTKQTLNDDSLNSSPAPPAKIVKFDDEMGSFDDDFSFANSMNISSETVVNIPKPERAEEEEDKEEAEVTGKVKFGNAMIMDDDDDLDALLNEIDDETFSAKVSTVQLNEIDDEMFNTNDDITVQVQNEQIRSQEVYSCTTSIANRRVFADESRVDFPLTCSTETTRNHIPEINLAQSPQAPVLITTTQSTNTRRRIIQQQLQGDRVRKQLVDRVVIAESFALEDLEHNMRVIVEDEDVGLDFVGNLRQAAKDGVRKIDDPVVLMVKEFKMIGGMAQIKFIDGRGDVIVGSMAVKPFVSEWRVKLHFGMILVIAQFTLFCPSTRALYLNLTASAIQAVYCNYRQLD